MGYITNVKGIKGFYASNHYLLFKIDFIIRLNIEKGLVYWSRLFSILIRKLKKKPQLFYLISV